MNEYRFSKGDVMTSKLNKEELIKRINRLDLLRVMTEQCECVAGQSICKKALKAYNKMENFTGIIHLTSLEKEWLWYMTEDSTLGGEKREVIEFYTK